MKRELYAELTDKEAAELVEASRNFETSGLSTFGLSGVCFNRDFLGLRYRGTIGGDNILIEFRGGRIYFHYSGRVRQYVGSHELSIGFCRDFIDAIRKFQVKWLK